MQIQQTRVAIINPKGGSGKTTIATNLAAHYAMLNHRVALLDHDSQGSSGQWLRSRDRCDAPSVHGVAMHDVPAGVTRSFAQRVPNDIDRVVVDTPAAYKKHELQHLINGADKIVLPVLPSEIDIQAAVRTIADLLLVARVNRREGRLGIVANRVKPNTIIFRTLMRFLASLDIPVVGQLRDTQNYIHAAREGLGVCELEGRDVRKDLAQWTEFVAWLEGKTPYNAEQRSPADRALSAARPTDANRHVIANQPAVASSINR